MILLSEAADVATVDQHGLMGVTRATARWMKLGIERLARHCPAATVDQVKPADVAAWIEAERRGGAARPVTINSYLRAVKVVYSRLERRGLVEVNPARPVPFLKEPPVNPKAICLMDYLKMRQAATCARDRALLDVLWASGCRLGGLVSMKIEKGRFESWIAADGRQCYALMVVEKGDRPRWVYCGRDEFEGRGLAEWLAERGDQAGALWVNLGSRNHGAPITAIGVQHVLRKMRVDAGIEGRPANAHAFRHAFALRMLNQGEDLSAVSAWLGHHSPEFTAARYAIRSEAQLREKFFG